MTRVAPSCILCPCSSLPTSPRSPASPKPRRRPPIPPTTFSTSSACSRPRASSRGKKAPTWTSWPRPRSFTSYSTIRRTTRSPPAPGRSAPRERGKRCRAPRTTRRAWRRSPMRSRSIRSRAGSPRRLSRRGCCRTPIESTRSARSGSRAASRPERRWGRPSTLRTIRSANAGRRTTRHSPWITSSGSY